MVGGDNKRKQPDKRKDAYISAPPPKKKEEGGSDLLINPTNANVVYDGICHAWHESTPHRDSRRDE